MIGILLVALGEIAAQIGFAIGKYEASHKHESYYALAFLTFFWSTPFFLLWGMYGPGEFIFSLESLPTFTARIILEIGVVYTGVHALVAADRSTFSFLRTLTIPLLLAVDLVLGYTLNLQQIAGIALIVFGALILASRHGLSRHGKALALLCALFAVGTISLFKYNITTYNSVEAEQFFTHLILLVAIWIAAYVHTGENVFRACKKRALLALSLVAGFASVLISFAMIFTTASIVTTIKRSVEILGSIVLGRAYFHEHHIVVKLIASLFILTGIVCISLFS